MTFELPKLNYSYDALEPFFDAKTMEIHHTKHHAAYTNKLNEAISGTELANKKIEQILQNAKNESPAIRNNAGGFYNHNLFFASLKKDVAIKGEIMQQIDKCFGSFTEFKNKFTQSSITRFGSGWAWLVVENGKLEIVSTPNQDNPLMDNDSCIPILGLDVWEHAYYLHYQNRRPDYVNAFFSVINWDFVNQQFLNAC